MKLAFLTASLNKKGKEEGFIVDWVEGLAKQVDDLVVIILSPQKTQLKAKNVRVYELTQNSKIGKLFYLFSVLVNEHSNTPFNGVFCHIFDFLAVAGGLWGRIFGVTTAMWFAGGNELKKPSLLYFAMKLNHKILTCSRWEKERYQKQYHLKQPIYVLGHAVNAAHFHPLPKKSTKTQTLTIGFVGRATPQKNIETLIEAVGLLQTKVKIKVYLALSRLSENKKYGQKINRAIQKHKTSHKVFVIKKDVNYSSLPQFYSTLSLYIHSSKMESVDKAGIEAMMSNVPVLLSKSSYREVVPKKYSPLLFDPNNSRQLAKKIERFIMTPSMKNQKNLQAYIKKTYDIEPFMKKLVKAF